MVASGSALAHVARRNDLERSTWYSGFLLTFLAEGDETGGQFCLVEARGARGQSLDPPLHVHAREDETFYMLEGEMAFEIEGQVIIAGPGDTVTLPRDVPHRFEIVSDEVHYLNLCTPAGFEGFFHALSEPAQSMTLPPPAGAPPDIARFIATAQSFGVTIMLDGSDEVPA